ncbi:helix-turn-helix domain-containing protein [Rhodococcus erythropolis]|uniref:helix-turn-helix domain-containing protein n=1 Tax=Rhodococcus erythropolis TaxID=1833 RepID=UPI001E598521|nr:helix-turn-helix transcriptional regulator [Rhodococcus erythropolis]
MHTGFGAWIRDQIDARGYQTVEEAARELGVYPSLLRHWATIVRSPAPKVLRRVAALFDAPIQEVLIAAGYMTEEENVPLSPTGMSLQQMSNKQILDEIRRRTAGDMGGTPIPVRVNGVLHTPGGLPTVSVSNAVGRPSVPTSPSPTARRLGASPALCVTTSQVRRASQAG